MKILAFVDLHGNKSALNKIITRASKKDIDAVVCAGDFTIFGGGQDLILSKLNKIGKPILVVHGNHEDEDEVEKGCSLFRHCHFIHKKNFRIGSHLFLGWGGGGFSFRDREFERYSKKLKKMIEKEDKVILLTHAPPYKTKADTIMKEHAGNKSLRKFIEVVKPELCVCGHLHECVSKDKIGKTLVINPGYKGKVISLWT